MGCSATKTPRTKEKQVSSAKRRLRIGRVIAHGLRNAKKWEKNEKKNNGNRTSMKIKIKIKRLEEENTSYMNIDNLTRRKC